MNDQQLLAAPSGRHNRYLRALARMPVDTTPVWIMRQAGRYLPEYRATRAQAGSFMTLCQTPELATEVTMQPLRRYELDAAILFSDILTIPDALGLGLHFVEGEGPRFESPLRSVADIDRLGRIDPEQQLRYVMDAVRMIRRELNGLVPLIGFSGSPWTLACYMLGGRSDSGFTEARQLAWNEPEAMHRLLALLAQIVVDYLAAQRAAGAQSLMIFDTWGGTLPYADYREYSLRYLAQIVDGLQAIDDPAPITLFSKGAQAHLSAMADTGCQALGLDWTASLKSARALVGDRVALQGNLDPAALRANPEALRNMVALTLADYGPGPGHVFNLGHGITPDIDPAQMKVVVDSVHRFGQQTNLLA
ncbi:MAG: uroporphyrinogen decarboxylase [Xanthomonadales bacterium]|nr:uroporphyrinogen decarboxylase [Xanthomonadales bacterium]